MGGLEVLVEQFSFRRERGLHLDIGGFSHPFGTYEIANSNPAVNCRALEFGHLRLCSASIGGGFHLQAPGWEHRE